MKEDRLISKSSYNYSQISGFISVKQYMLIRSEGKKCALLRFVNETDYTVDHFEFAVVQLDSKGAIIGRSTVECSNLKFNAGNTYAMNKGVVVDEKCADIRVQMISARSGRYRYTVSGGRRIVVNYDYDEHWKYLSNEEVSSMLKENKQFAEFDSRKKDMHPGRLIKFIAVLTVFFLLYANGQPYVDRLMSYLGLDAEYQTEKYDISSISGVDYVEI